MTVWTTIQPSIATTAKTTVRVSRVICRDVLQLQRRCFTMESRVCLSPIEFTGADFERLKREHDKWFSPSIYAHTGGSRVCLNVYTNECRTQLIMRGVSGHFEATLSFNF